MSETASNKIDITVVCQEHSMKNVLLKIKMWHLSNQLASSCIRHVQYENNLSAGLKSAREFPNKSILIPIGFKDTEIFHSLNKQDLQHLEIIIRPPRTGRQANPEINEQPLASLLDYNPVINVQDTLPALRKSLLKMQLKNKVTIRELTSTDDFIQYFSLRYKIWRSMGYLSKECDCEDIGLELNYSDRTAYPIGAFTPRGELIGCARLVFPIGHDSHHLPLISELVDGKKDDKLTTNYEYPLTMVHPFDILESLAGFRSYFACLVRDKVKYAEVSRVIVAPEYRGDGLGEVLVDSLLSLARRYSLGLLFLACHEDLHPFYQRCGFSVLPGLSCEHFAGVNAPAVAMVLDFKKDKHQNMN
ncbi:GNAT family N-acetyltransferase [Methyloglobulus sp.]|uniref:GNAT family N-acetyltransferase n=1 Tax=Methyloglobulus sp. TaxID=2518622 RepID=UPI00398A4E98